MLNIKKKPAEQRVFASLKVKHSGLRWAVTLETEGCIYCYTSESSPTFGELLTFIRQTGTSPQNVRIAL